MSAVKILPNIPLRQWWPAERVQEVIPAYKKAEENGEITIPNGGIIFNKRTGSMIIQFLSISPEEWINEKLKQYMEDAKQ